MNPLPLFLSYSSQDKESIHWLRQGLEQNGYSVWSYETNSVPGISYLQQVGEAIDRASAMVVFLTRSSIASHQVCGEVVRAYEAQRPIIPVLAGVEYEEMRANPVLWQALRLATAVKILGVHGEFGQSAYTADELYNKHGFGIAGITAAAKAIA